MSEENLPPGEWVWNEMAGDYAWLPRNPDEWKAPIVLRSRGKS